MYRTKSLFHYTQSLESVVEILQSGMLIPNYCKEDLTTTMMGTQYFGIPMVCFCDIPLSLSAHLKCNYGNYAIAFDKDWGIKNGCNPVHYITNEGIINSALYSIGRIWDLRDKVELNSTSEKAHRLFKDRLIEAMEYNDDNSLHNFLLGYLKRYNSEWKEDVYCNYDENEWRYVLYDGNQGVKWLYNKEYDEWRGEMYVIDENGERRTTPKPKVTDIFKRSSIKFKVSDIKHIILAKESDVASLAEIFIKPTLLCGKMSSENERMELLTKITSFERIQSDY